MGTFHFGPDNPDKMYVPHSYTEHTVDLGEVIIVVAYEKAIDSFNVSFPANLYCITSWCAASSGVFSKACR